MRVRGRVRVRLPIVANASARPHDQHVHLAKGCCALGLWAMGLQSSYSAAKSPCNEGKITYQCVGFVAAAKASNRKALKFADL